MPGCGQDPLWKTLPGAFQGAHREVSKQVSFFTSIFSCLFFKFFSHNLDFIPILWYHGSIKAVCPIEINENGDIIMERIKTLATRNLCESAKNGGCGECQTSCQSACKTSCGVANQSCEKK